MNIAVCDDEKIMRETLSCDYIRYREENDLDLEIIEFSNGAEVLGYHEHIDLIFLDIGLPGMSGIELKKHILLMDNIDYIVFVSGYKERVWSLSAIKHLVS
jgi:DNA-binding LytR/AlgR family response regulator